MNSKTIVRVQFFFNVFEYIHLRGVTLASTSKHRKKSTNQKKIPQIKKIQKKSKDAYLCAQAEEVFELYKKKTQEVTKQKKQKTTTTTKIRSAEEANKRKLTECIPS